MRSMVEGARARTLPGVWGAVHFCRLGALGAPSTAPRAVPLPRYAGKDQVRRETCVHPLSRLSGRGRFGGR